MNILSCDLQIYLDLGGILLLFENAQANPDCLNIVGTVK